MKYALITLIYILIGYNSTGYYQQIEECRLVFKLDKKIFFENMANGGEPIHLRADYNCLLGLKIPKFTLNTIQNLDSTNKCNVHLIVQYFRKNFIGCFVPKPLSWSVI
ncbi:MAG: hypothetical protein ACJA01_003820 [Saprospiraceae bacterium]|jgi:hypothetical protein